MCQKQNIRTLLTELLNMPATGEALELAEKAGLVAEPPSNMAVVAVALMREAQRGNVKAVKCLNELTGEDPFLQMDRERLKMDKERLRMEKEKLSAARGNPEQMKDDPLSAALMEEAERMNDGNLG